MNTSKNKMEVKDSHSVKYGTEKNDVIYMSSSGGTVFVGAGNDVVFGSVKNDLILGGKGNDDLRGYLGDDQIFGGDGDDILVGGDGNDILSGDSGNDALMGGPGNDTLIGGAGRDIFCIGKGKGNEVILDFSPTDDYIMISGFTEKESQAFTKTQYGDSVHMELGNGQVLVINNVQVDTLYARNLRIYYLPEETNTSETLVSNLSTKNTSYSDSGLHEAANQEPAPEFAVSSTVYDVYL
jgi:Ca2+-binding RTX toxin-like protein